MLKSETMRPVAIVGLVACAWLWVGCGGESRGSGGASGGDPGEAGEAGQAQGDGGSAQGDSGSSQGAAGSSSTSGGHLGEGGSTTGGFSTGGEYPPGGALGYGGDGAGSTGHSGNGSGGQGQGGLVVAGGTSNGTGGQAAGGTGQGQGGAIELGGLGGVPACTETDQAATNQYRVRGTTVGTNGTYSDYCTEDGNLVEYSCEMGCDSYALGYGGLPITAGAAGAITSQVLPIVCMPYAIGPVIEAEVNCDGRCQDGTCFGWCPDFGDSLTVSGVSGGEVAMETPNGYSLKCEVTVTQPGYDCAEPILVGTSLNVLALGSCTTAATYFGTDLPNSIGNQACSYGCTVQF